MKSKQFGKLDQLDRIEYFLLNENLKFVSYSINFIFYFMFLLISILMLGFILYFGNGSIAILNIIPSLTLVFKYGIIALIILDLIFFAIDYNKKSKLEKYFLKKNGLK